MPEITLNPEQKKVIVEKIKLYFREELDQDIGGFDAEFLLDFFLEEMGGYFYNQGLYDAQQLLSEKLDDLSECIFNLEKPVQ